MDRKQLVKEIVDLCYNNREGHLGSSLSVLDLLMVLYKEQITEFKSLDRNRLILSKGHSSLGLYVVLNKFGFLEEDIQTFGKFYSNLGGHPSDKISAVEASTGSLGHGLPIAVGMAMAYKIQNFSNRIFVIVGDGELNEGSNWEAMLLAAHHNLDNLVCIVDYNHSNDRALRLDNLRSKIESFKWNVREVDGHDLEKISETLMERKYISEPTLIIAHTIKGRGVSFMEQNPEWHHKIPNATEYQNILKELGNE